MILRGIIRGVPTGNVSIVDGKEIVDNKYKVEIPSLKTSQNSITTKTSAFFMDALLSYQPGNLNSYSIGDVVFLSVTDQEELPIIIGKMYVGDNEKATDNINANTINVVGQTTLSKNTTIGELTYNDLDNKQNKKVTGSWVVSTSNPKPMVDIILEHPDIKMYYRAYTSGTKKTDIANVIFYASYGETQNIYTLTLKYMNAGGSLTTIGSGTIYYEYFE